MTENETIRRTFRRNARALALKPASPWVDLVRRPVAVSSRVERTAAAGAEAAAPGGRE